MGRIALVLACNTHWAPYMHRYINELSDRGKEFVLFYWDRESLHEEHPFETKAFMFPDVIGKHGWKKPILFLKFAFFIKKELKNEKFEKIIFLGTYACVPALIGSFLEKHYKNKYWVDIRDLTYEQNGIFRKMQDRIILNSYKTVISSKGFESLLPFYQYGYIHNIDPNIEEMAIRLQKIESDKIRISYIGNVGFYSECQKFIDAFANDPRFVLGFYGAGSEVLERYCAERKIENVSFAGRFDRSKTLDFYAQTDIIYNNYGNQNINLRTALSNKLYYAIRLNYPIVVSKDTYMEKISVNYRFGFSTEYSDNLPDSLYDWYQSYKSKEIDVSFLWSEIIQEDDAVNLEFRKFIGFLGKI